MGEGFNFGWTIPWKILFFGFFGQPTNSEEVVTARFFQLRDFPKMKATLPFFSRCGRNDSCFWSRLPSAAAIHRWTRLAPCLGHSWPKRRSQDLWLICHDPWLPIQWIIVLITFAEARRPARHDTTCCFTLSHAAKIPALNQRWPNSDRLGCFTSETLFSSTFKKNKSELTGFFF